MQRTNLWIAGAGAALLIGFFMPWFDLGMGFQATGWDIVKTSELSWVTRLAVLACPFVGAALLLAALGATRSVAAFSIGTGCAVLGFTAYKVADAFITVSGTGLWLVLSAGTVALVAGLTSRSISR
jgi:hypothetical protein